MTTYAGAIAARLQRAHERRREDEDMAGRTRKPVEPAAGTNGSVWDEAARQIAQTLTMVRENVEAGLPDADPQASAVTAERVVELERERDRARELNLEKIQEIGTVKGERDEARERVEELEHERDTLRTGLELASKQRDELERQLAEARSDLEGARREIEKWAKTQAITQDTLATAYVAREVPWSDVAAGMMTIARDGTPWMVGRWLNGNQAGAVQLVNGERAFTKTPAEGEAVRVLVPYVTPEQAEALVASELGGRA